MWAPDLNLYRPIRGQDMMVSANQRPGRDLCLCCGELARGEGRASDRQINPGSRIGGNGQNQDSGIRIDASGIRTSKNTIVVIDPSD